MAVLGVAEGTGQLWSLGCGELFPGGQGDEA
jgi:hypothetical protein